MSDLPSESWYPDAEDLATAHVGALAARFGLADYDSLLAASIERPDAYWMEVIDFLGIRWSRRPEAYVDLSRGREFPRWFVGGKLNWVDTVLGWAQDARLADRNAIVAEREDGSVSHVTFRELPAMVRRLAAGLTAQGVAKGDRVGLLMENGVEATLSVLALAYIGAIVVPLFSGFGVDAIVARLQSCRAGALIASTGFHRRSRWVDTVTPVVEALGRLPEIRTVIWKGTPGTMPPGAVDWHEVSQGETAPPASVQMSPDDPFMVIYTSGTTGKPKGAVHTHGGFPLKIAHDSAVHFDVGPGDIFCWPADMGWIAGTLVLSTALMRGATLVCYDGAPDFPDWSRMSRLIERHRVTHFGSAPTLIRGLAANMPLSTAGDMSTVKILITAGEGIDPEHFLWFQRNFGRGRRPVINYTGGTEVSGALLSSVIVKPIAPAGFNTTSPAVAVAVVDPRGSTVTDRIGELAVMEPFVGMTRSFWEDDERYLASYWRTVPGIWVHGDLAIKTAQGGFFMLGRSDDTIKVAGKRLGPAEVEEILLELPEVSEAAAIGIDDATKGQKLVVFIIATAQWNQDMLALARTVGDHVSARLGKPFRPSDVHLVNQLPKTRSSKVMRRLIRNAYSGQPLGDLSALDNPASIDEIRRTAPDRRG